MRNHHPSLSKPDDDPDPIRPPTANLTLSAGVGLRKKAAGVRPWLLLDSTGQAQVVEAGKHAIMRRTGLPARDLRILDPLLSYPSTVLGRERAIVINLEHIKAIITAQEVLLMNSRDPSVVPFVEELQSRILCHYQATKSQEINGEDSNWTNLYDLEAPQSRTSSPQNFSGGFPQFEDENEERKEDGKQSLENRDGSKVLPFEFVALEACLEAACSCLENEAKTLEQEAHPALDKLTSKISTLNLERVRQIKSRLVAITGRVQKVETTAEISLEATGGSTSYEADFQNTENIHDNLFTQNLHSRASHGTRTSTTHSAISKHLDVEELEMLLEAYFVQIDGTLNKLSTLREYVDDTEDYINIMLDDKQNHLLQMGVMLTTATLVVSAFVVVAGIFGMNINIELFDEHKSGMQEFLWTVGGGATGSIFLYVVAIAWCKHKRLLE
ncbi:Magnesium transporter MRS2-3 [Citrus sinensis]|uniref:Magnesium transporter MRS2-3 n=1 Tax=Citrus sinensis TaxID=2711 RepID=A0ACB8IDE9_CITSI|nr:Magnesium transporter MRS2-3 [Citrus sinensis]